MMTDASLRLYTLAEIEELSGGTLKRDSLEREIDAGRLKPTRVRRRVFIRAVNLEAWLFACEVQEESVSTICRRPKGVEPMSSEERRQMSRNLKAFALGRTR